MSTLDGLFLDDTTLEDSKNEFLFATEQGRGVRERYNISPPAERTVAEEAKLGIQTGVENIGQQFVATGAMFGIPGAEEKRQKMEAESQLLENERQITGGFANWAVRNTTQGVTELLPTVAVGLATGGVGAAAGLSAEGVATARIAASFASAYARNVGSSYYEMKRIAPNEDDGMLRATAATVGITIAALETMGTEPKILDPHNRARLAGRIFDALKSDGGSVSELTRIASLSGKSFTREFAKTQVEEISTELLQQVAQDAATYLATGENQFSKESYIELLKSLPFQTLAGSVVAGYTSSHAAAREEMFVQQVARTAPNAQDYAAAYSTKAGAVDEAQARASYDADVASLATNLREGLTAHKSRMGAPTDNVEQESKAVATSLMTLAVNLSAMSEDTTPTTMIDTFNMAFVGGLFDMDKVSKMAASGDQAGLMQYMLEDPQFQNTVYSTRERREQVQMEQELESIRQDIANTDKRYSIPTEERARRIGSVLEKAQFIDRAVAQADAAVEAERGAPSQLTTNTIIIDRVEPTGTTLVGTVVTPDNAKLLPPELWKMLYVMGPTDVEVYGERVRATVHDDGSVSFSEPITVEKVVDDKTVTGRARDIVAGQIRGEKSIRLRQMNADAAWEALQAYQPQPAPEAAGGPVALLEGEAATTTPLEPLNALETTLAGREQVAKMRRKQALAAVAELNRLRKERKGPSLDEARRTGIMAVLNRELGGKPVYHDIKDKRGNILVKHGGKFNRNKIAIFYDNFDMIDWSDYEAPMLKLYESVESARKMTQESIKAEKTPVATIKDFDSIPEDYQRGLQAVALLDILRDYKERAVAAEALLPEAERMADEEAAALQKGVDDAIAQLSESEQQLIELADKDLEKAEKMAERKKLLVKLGQKIGDASPEVMETVSKIRSEMAASWAQGMKERKAELDTISHLRRVKKQQDQARKAGFNITVFSKNGDTNPTIHAAYSKEYQLAIFYDTATSFDILHEWTHHIIEQGFIPAAHLGVLTQVFGKGTFDGNAEEAAVRSFVDYLSTGKLPDKAPPSLVAAMEYLRGATAAVFGHEAHKINPEAQAVFDKWLVGIEPGQDAKLVGAAVADATLQAERPAPQDLAFAREITETGYTSRKNQINAIKNARVDDVYPSLRDALADEVRKFHNNRLGPQEIALLDRILAAAESEDVNKRIWAISQVRKMVRVNGNTTAGKAALTRIVEITNLVDAPVQTLMSDIVDDMPQQPELFAFSSMFLPGRDGVVENANLSMLSEVLTRNNRLLSLISAGQNWKAMVMHDAPVKVVGTVKDLIGHIRQVYDNHPRKHAYELLLQAAEETLDTETADLLLMSNMNDEGAGRWGRMYDHSTRNPEEAIMLNVHTMYTTMDCVDGCMHEIVHALTQVQLRGTQHVYYRSLLRQLMNDVQESLPADTLDQFAYYFSSVSEFLAGAMTDEDFMIHLSSIKARGQTIQEQFSDWMNEFAQASIEGIGFTFSGGDEKMAFGEAVKILANFMADDAARKSRDAEYAAKRKRGMIFSMSESEEVRRKARNEIFRRYSAVGATQESMDDYARSLGYQGDSPRRSLTLDQLKNYTATRVGSRSMMKALAMDMYGIDLDKEPGTIEQGIAIAKILQARERANKIKTTPAVDELRADLVESLSGMRSHVSDRAKAAGSTGFFAHLENAFRRAQKAMGNWSDSLLGGTLTEQFSGFENTLLHLFDGRADDATFVKIWRKWSDMQRSEVKARTESSDFILNQIKEFGGEKAFPTAMGHHLGINGYQYSVNDMIGIYLIARGDVNGEGAKTLFESNPDLHAIERIAGETEEQYAARRKAHFDLLIKETAKYVQNNEQARNMAKLIDNYSEWVFDKLDNVYFKLHSEHLGKAKFYFPRVREGGVFADGDWMAELMEIVPAKTRARLNPDARFKKRTPGVKAGRIKLEVLEVFNNYRRQADNYIGKAETIAELSSLFSADSRTITNLAIDKGRVGELRLLAKFLERERYATGRMEPMSNWEVGLKKIRTNAQLAILVGNIPSVMRQFISAPLAASEIPGWKAPFKIAMELNRVLWGSSYRGILNSVFHGNRDPNDAIKGHRAYALMRKHNSIHLHDPVDFDYVSMMDGRIRSIRVVPGMKVRDVAMLPQRFIDTAVRMSTWIVAYDYELEQGIKRGVKSMAQIEADAAHFADTTLNRGQEPANTANRNMAQTGPEAMRMMIPFTGQPMVSFDYIRNHMWRPMEMAWKSGNGTIESINNLARVLLVDPPPGTTTTVGRKVFFGLIVPALAMGFIARGRGPENWDEVALDVFAYNLSFIPIIGPVLTTSIMADQFFETGAPMYSDLLSVLGEVAYNIKKSASGEADKKDIANNLMYASQFMGLPREAIRQLNYVTSGFWQENGLTSASLKAALITRKKTVDED